MELDLKLLADNQLTPNEYVLLYTKINNIDFIPLGVDMKKLQELEFVKITNSEEKEFVVRQKGINLINKTKTLNPKTISAEAAAVKNWIDDFRDLFPLKTPSGRLLKSTRGNCVNKMQIFIKEYSKRGNLMNKEKILEATKKYLEYQKSKDNYEYTKQANNFIYKDTRDNSILYQFIELIENGEADNLISDGTKSMMNDY